MQPVDYEDDDYSPSEALAPAQSLAAPSKSPDLGPVSGPAATQLSLVVPYGFAGARFDQAVAELVPDHSRSRLTAMIKAGSILLDGVPAAAKTRLVGGETILATLTPRPEDSAFTAEDVPIEVVFEDEAIIVVNKRAGLVVHPAAGNWSGTLLNALLFRNPAAASLARAGIVHRLDKDTSGVMVAAKTEAAQLSLVRQLQERSMTRLYLALARGYTDKEGTVDAPIGRHPRDRVRMAVVEEERGGKPAVTHYRVVRRLPMHTLIECKLETGRTHQIRVHMQSIGFPLEGDPVYGPKPLSEAAGGLDAGARAAVAAFGRQALHARRLELINPASGKAMQFEAPVPDDFETLLAAMEDL